MSPIVQSTRALQSLAAAVLSSAAYAVLWPLTVIRITLAIGLMRIASSIPILKDRIKRYNEKFLLVPYEDFWQSWCSWKMLRAVMQLTLGDLNKTARLGSPAPDCELVSTDQKECRLLDLARGERPLVLNFGSCSWPPFFIRLKNDFTKVVRDYADVADFKVIYISEAHPSDGWKWNVSFGFCCSVFFFSFLCYLWFCLFVCLYKYIFKRILQFISSVIVCCISNLIITKHHLLLNCEDVSMLAIGGMKYIMLLFIT